MKLSQEIKYERLFCQRPERRVSSYPERRVSSYPRPPVYHRNDLSRGFYSLLPIVIHLRKQDIY